MANGLRSLVGYDALEGDERLNEASKVVSGMLDGRPGAFPEG